MYDRNVLDRELTFEASGGLVNGTLVLQDRETDSYWPIMHGRSFHGALQGTPLRELTVNDKVRWRDWRARHPDTRVLSVGGVEDQEPRYDKYFASPEGFRGLVAHDDRLATKQPIFAFRLDGQPYAARYEDFIGGRVFRVGGVGVFLYRADGVDLRDASAAYLSPHYATPATGIPGPVAGCRFDAQGKRYEGADCPARIAGFDTFWYSWSLNNPDTRLLAVD